MTPEEIGHAAAYESYRTWIHNRSMYQHFHDDIERQREALTGLAVAEGGQYILLGHSQSHPSHQLLDYSISVPSQEISMHA